MPHSWKSRVTAEISILEHCAVPYCDIIGMSSLVHTAERVKIAGGFTLIVTDTVMWLFLTLPRVGLHCVIEVFPDHAHFLYDT